MPVGHKDDDDYDKYVLEMKRKDTYDCDTAKLQCMKKDEDMAEKNEVVVNGSPFSVSEKKVMLKALNGLAASITRAKTKDINDPELVAVRDKQLREISALITKEMFHEAR